MGNIKAARDLLGRHDIDPSIKDAEGLTAYDLYNGTVDGVRRLFWSSIEADALQTNPPQDAEGTDLYVWGVNSEFIGICSTSAGRRADDFTGNFALGNGDSSDKAYPDRVNLLTQNQASDHPDPAQRFHHVGLKDVVMAKLHTGVITTESRGNLSLCGFGSNGRFVIHLHIFLILTLMPDLGAPFIRSFPFSPCRIYHTPSSPSP